MSGHSKWATIKHKKESQDAKRGQVFTRLSRAISIAAREGGSPNPDTNYKLRLAIEQAKKANMPLEKIKRAIDRVYGKDKETIENITLEVFGPNGVGIIIKGMTDNRRRFISSVKNILAKNGGSLGQSGAVSYMFTEVVSLGIRGKMSDEDLLKLAEEGLIDFKSTGEGITLYLEPDRANIIRQKLLDQNYQLTEEKLEFLAKNKISLDEASWQRFNNLINKLDSLDDVYVIFHNAVKA